MTTTEKDVPLSVKIPKPMRMKVDKFRESMAKEWPGSAPSLSDAVRVLIERGLGR
jgi:hypothetical protein